MANDTVASETAETAGTVGTGTAAAGTAAIETDGLTKRFGHFTALDGLSIRVEPGEVFGFLGPNGAGKTTTIRMLLGLARPTSGSARIFGHDAWRESVAAHRRLAFVPGEMDVWPTLRGGEIIDLLGRAHGGYDPARRDQLYERFEFDPTKRGRDYSKGNRQKIGLIAALMVEPDLLVLDEPTSGLDPLMEVVFRNCVLEARERGQTVLLSSHILSEVEALCDRVAILREGKIVDIGTFEQLGHLDARSVSVVFGGAPPDLSSVDGIENVQPDEDGHTLHFDLHGAPGPMLAALAGDDVTSIDIREPSLEQLFLAYYGDQVDTVRGNRS
ncbi:ABC transporter ATP-binding protein [soil metagenome]